MAELIQKQDTLNEGRVKINAAITDAEQAKVTAGDADSKATQALANSESTQTQLDTIVINGDSSVEAAQARVDEKGVGHTTLKDRIDDGFTKVTSQLNETESKINIRKHEYTSAPLVTFSFDDAKVEDRTRFEPIFDEEGIVGAICAITDQVDVFSSSLTTKDLQELHEKGWSVASHTANHLRLDDESEETIDYELRSSQLFLKERGLDYDILVLPFGGYDKRVLKIARKYYDYTVDIDRKFTNLPTNFRNMRISRVPGLSQPNATLESCKAFVDDAISNGNWVIFEDHSHYPFFANQSNLGLLRELIQYVKSKNIEIVNYREGIERKANIIEIRDEIKETYFSVNVNGQVTSNALPIVFDTISSDSIINNDSPIFDYPLKALSEFRISSAEATSRGFPSAGSIKTHRHDSAYYSYQLLDVYKENKTLRRYWDGAADKWSNWEIIIDTKRGETYSLGTITSTSSISGDSPLQDFPQSAVTEYRIDANTATVKNFPGGEAGFLTVHRHGSDFYGYQTYDVYRKNKRLRRNWNEGGKSWDAWKVIYDVN